LEPLKTKSADPLLGKLFGGCRIERMIGKGGMGAVYLATQLNLDRPVAIKVIAPDIIDDDESLQRLNREAKIVANLSHPNIVQLHFTGKEYNYPYLVMEYVDGQSLGAMLRGLGKIGVSPACDVMLQVGFALEAAAALSVVHRDIKPDNILITPDGHVKVTDFGLARRATDNQARLTLTGQSLGTPHYMSPEQAEGHSMDVRSDIYSLGITFWQCLAGFPPFDGETPFAILMKQVHEKLPDIRVVNPDVPKEVAEIIAAMTVKDPVTRISDPAEVVRRLKKYMAGPDVKREKLRAESRGLMDGAGATLESAPFDSDPDNISQQAQRAYRDTSIRMAAARAGAAAGITKEAPPPPPPTAPLKTSRRKFLVVASAGAVVAGAGLTGLVFGRSRAKPAPTMKFELRRTIIGHTNAVKSVHFGHLGEFLVSGGADRTVRVWREANGIQVQNLSGHSKMVTAVQWNPDQDTIASASLDHTVRIWDAEGGKELRPLRGHTNTVTSLSWSPDGEILASGSMDQTVILWDWKKGVNRRTLKAHTGMVTCLEFRSDGTLLASGGADRRVVLWDAGNYRDFRTYYPHATAMVTTIAFSPDGQVLATGGQDHLIRLLSSANGAEIRTLDGHEKSVQSLAFSADGRYLASGGADGSIRLWDVDKGQEVAAYSGEPMIWSVRFNPKGLFLAAGAQDGQILNFELTKIGAK
jgi:serine/threonine protein kinase